MTVQDYKVQHRPAGGGEWSSTIRTVTNATLTVAGPSEIRVRARETQDKASAWRDAIVPGPPFNLSQGASGTEGTIRLDFTKDAKAATTQVFVSTGTDAVVATLAGTVSGSSFTGSYGAGVTRSFWLRSVAADGNVSSLSARFAAVGEWSPPPTDPGGGWTARPASRPRRRCSAPTAPGCGSTRCGQAICCVAAVAR